MGESVRVGVANSRSRFPLSQATLAHRMGEGLGVRATELLRSGAFSGIPVFRLNLFLSVCYALEGDRVAKPFLRCIIPVGSLPF